VSEYDNTNSGALFKNDKGDNPKRPDYKGQLNVGGVEYWLSAWLRTSKDGKKYMGLRVELKGEKLPTAPTQVPIATEPAPEFNDDIPF
jgi:uncharacterized protein (DUF736 family)